MSSIKGFQAPVFPLYQLPLATSRPSGLGQHEPVDRFVASHSSAQEGSPLNWSRAIAFKAAVASDPFRAGGCDENSCHRRPSEKVGDPKAVEENVEALHMTLSAGSLIPFVGTVASLLDALLQAARGKWQDVALDLAGAIPLAGTVAKGAALVKGGLAVKGAVAAKSLMVVKSSAAGIVMHAPRGILNDALSVARREAAEVAKQTEKAGVQAAEKLAERSLASELEEGAAYYRQLSKGGHAPPPLLSAPAPHHPSRPWVQLRLVARPEKARSNADFGADPNCYAWTSWRKKSRR